QDGRGEADHGGLDADVPAEHDRHGDRAQRDEADDEEQHQDPPAAPAFLGHRRDHGLRHEDSVATAHPAPPIVSTTHVPYGQNGVVRDLATAWRAAALGAGATADQHAVDAEGSALLARWAEPHRRYHSLEHLATVLAI